MQGDVEPLIQSQSVYTSLSTMLRSFPTLALLSIPSPVLLVPEIIHRDAWKGARQNTLPFWERRNNKPKVGPGMLISVANCGFTAHRTISIPAVTPA